MPPSPMLGRKLTPAEVAILETFVIPRYLEKFGEALLSAMLFGPSVKIAHFGCRTGYPDREIIDLADGCELVGVDASIAAVELARNKAATLVGAALRYYSAKEFPTELESDTFSHAMSLHPIGTDEERQELFQEMHRVLYPGGQALVSVPMRGSFQEVGDLFKEFGLKNDKAELGKAAELAMLARPTAETLSDELESVGFDDVDITTRQVTLSFESGRAFTDDPVTRLMVIPEHRAHMGDIDFEEPLRYLNDAIGKYWAGREFELAVVVGTASARKS